MQSPLNAWTGSAEPIQPFWKRVPKFFRFPVYLPPLLRNLGLSAVLATAIDSEVPAVVFLAMLLVAIVLTRYGFLVIERASQGYLRPEDYPLHVEESSPWRPYKLFAVLFVAELVVELLAWGTRSAFLLAMAQLLLALAIPASVISIVQTDSLREALNPVRLVNTAWRIGVPYLALWFYLFLLMGGAGAAFRLVAPVVIDHVWLFVGVWAFLSIYFFQVMCALLGYVMYQYHEALGVAVMGPGDSGRPVVKGRVDVAARNRDALIAQMVAAGEVREATALVGEALADKPNDLSLHGRMRRLLLAENDVARLEEHCDRYLALLVKSGNLDEALALVDEEMARREGYRPREAAQIPVLARHALERGKFKLASDLVRGFDKRFPGAAETAQVYLIGARILAEGARDDDKSRRLFEHVMRNWPADPAAAEASRHLEALERLAAGKPS